MLCFDPGSRLTATSASGPTCPHAAATARSQSPRYMSKFRSRCFTFPRTWFVRACPVRGSVQVSSLPCRRGSFAQA